MGEGGNLVSNLQYSTVVLDKRVSLFINWLSMSDCSLNCIPLNPVTVSRKKLLPVASLHVMHFFTCFCVCLCNIFEKFRKINSFYTSKKAPLITGFD